MRDTALSPVRLSVRRIIQYNTHRLPPVSRLLVLTRAAALAMDEAKVRELLSHTARVCPQSRSASCPYLPLTCAPAPNIRVDVGDPPAVHRRLLTHRLAFCAQVNSGRREPSKTVGGRAVRPGASPEPHGPGMASAAFSASKAGRLSGTAHDVRALQVQRKRPLQHAFVPAGLAVAALDHVLVCC